jgi:hypothetical protein
MFFYYFSSVAIGYLTYSLTSANRTGGRNKFDMIMSKLTGHDVNTSAKFTIRITPNCAIRIHIHHWLYLSFMFLIFENIYVKGFCLGGIAQGILHYDDWHKIVQAQI